MIKMNNILIQKCNLTIITLFLKYAEKQLT